MTRLPMRAAALAALAVIAGLATAAPAAAQPADVEVTLGDNQTSVGVGDRITIRAQIVNRGAERTDPLVAHLNVATLDSEVYVDLEDWTASPTQEIPPLPPGGSASADWEIQAVNVGEFDVYVVVLPNGTASAGQGPLVASPPELVRVAGRRTLSPAGALPLAIAEPVLLGLLAMGVWVRRRR
ncbi:MAG TPA: hypothetical protein VFR67_06265 [Pilimelia sp.]|nr:hypothetical protein [Pilimelia sp.]